jgi:hypothetical protein
MKKREAKGRVRRGVDCARIKKTQGNGSLFEPDFARFSSARHDPIASNRFCFSGPLCSFFW